MNESLQIGIIGLGYWGPNLVRNFRSVEGATVRICCDLELSRFQKLASQYSDLDFTTSAREVIEHPGIDAVVIATPVVTHFELARMALTAGKSVLVEKPLSLRVEEATELVELADRKGLTLQVDHVFVYSPAVKQIKRIVDSGRLGRLFFIDSVRINLGLFSVTSTFSGTSLHMIFRSSITLSGKCPAASRLSAAYTPTKRWRT